MSLNKKELDSMLGLKSRVSLGWGIVVSALLLLLLVASIAVITIDMASEPDDGLQDYDSYVELGEYKGLNISSQKADVTDDDIQKQIDILIESYGGIYIEDEEGVVDDGDQVEVLYSQAASATSPFNEELANGITVIVGNGELPEEFVKPLVGHKLGDDVAVTMDTGEIYIVRIGHVHKKGELTDEYVSSLGITDVNTKDELYSNMKKHLEKKAMSEYKEAAGEELISLLYNGSTFKDMPDELVEPFKKVLKKRLDNTISSREAQGEAVTYDDLLADTYERDGISTVDEYLDIYGLQNARIYAMCLKLSRKEGITASNDSIYSLAATDWLNVMDEYPTLKEFVYIKGLTVYERAALLEEVKGYLIEVNTGEE